MNHMLSQHTFWRENRNVSFSDSVYLDIYAVILLILESPWAQREATIATVNRFTVRTTPCLVCERFNCYGLDVGRECGEFTWHYTPCCLETGSLHPGIRDGICSLGVGGAQVVGKP